MTQVDKLLGPLVAPPTLPVIAGMEAVLELDSENARASRWHTDRTYVENQEPKS